MKALFTLLIVFLMHSEIQARLLNYPDQKTLTKESEVIAILKPISTIKSDILYEGNLHGFNQKYFQGWITTLEIVTVFKGKVGLKRPIRILHYTYASGQDIMPNGALFIKFPIQAAERKIILSRDGTKVNESSYPKYIPNWLSYLKIRKDGIYEPMVDQYDSSYSFVEVAPR